MIPANPKFNTLFSAPVLNRSGYGVTADLIWKALSTYPGINLRTQSLTWGNCAYRMLEGPNDQAIKASIVSGNIAQPHVEIQCTLPHAHNPGGSIFNANFNAGTEVTKAPKSMVIGANRFDLICVPSQHTKQAYLNSDTKLTAPVEILPWSVDTEIFKVNAPSDPCVDEVLAKIKEPGAFLFCGQITNQNINFDRKDLANLIRTFCLTFKDKPNKPALILKTSGVNYSILDRNNTIERINQIKIADVPIYVLHGELTEPQMAALNSHKKIIAHVSFTHGEGCGLPLLEFSMCGKPIFVTGWSGQLDFLPTDKAQLLDYSLDVIDPKLESEYFPKGSSWATVKYKEAGERLLAFYEGDREIINKQAIELAHINKHKYSLPAFENKLHNILDKYLGTL